MSRTLRFALLGMGGFSLGGALGGAVWVAFDAPYLGFAILGAVGGAALGMALGNRRKELYLTLSGAAGFDLGFLLGFFIAILAWDPPYRIPLIGALGGAIGGAFFGRIMGNWKFMLILSIASALGFALGEVLSTWLVGRRGLEPQVFWGGVLLAIWGGTGGAILGAVMGYNKKG